MNKQMKAQLTSVITSLINEESSTAETSIHDYVCLKSQAILLGEEDMDEEDDKEDKDEDKKDDDEECDKDDKECDEEDDKEDKDEDKKDSKK